MSAVWRALNDNHSHEMVEDVLEDLRAACEIGRHHSQHEALLTQAWHKVKDAYEQSEQADVAEDVFLVLVAVAESSSSGSES